MRWLGDPVRTDGVAERSFEVDGTVLGIAWFPAGTSGPRPAVLLGHGGSGHKRTERHLRLGRWFALRGVAAAAIDGPFHGDRLPSPLSVREYRERMAADVGKVTDGMVGDWTATVDALVEQGEVDGGRIGYVGLSMGTRFGLPYAAAARPGLRCAVLGKFAMRQPAAMPEGLDMTARFSQDAPRLQAPVLFHMQWDDELFAREDQLALFDLLGSRDKRLIAFPGSHATTHPAAERSWCGFVMEHLGLGSED